MYFTQHSLHNTRTLDIDNLTSAKYLITAVLSNTLIMFTTELNYPIYFPLISYLGENRLTQDKKTIFIN